MKTAIIIGVGPFEGVGGYLCDYAAKQGLHVIAAGRTQTKLDAVVSQVKANGGQATAIVCDATVEAEVIDLVRQPEAIGPVDLAIYNAGNNFNGDFLTMEAEFFEKCWRVCTLGGFLFARETLKVMQDRQAGTLLFTGASASLRGRENFGAFNSSKGALRNLAQAMACCMMGYD